MIDQNWYKTSAINEYQYGYDADSNVLWKQNMLSSTNSELYADNSGNAYDGLNRLQHFQRGTLSTGHDSIQGSAGHSQDWGLDQVGNATSITTDGGTPQSRGINQQNEITSITGFTTPGYDSDGNTTTDETNHALTYDAWNRLMSYGGSSETFTYDALGRRITNLVSSTTTHLYYSKDWQVVEERLNSSTSANTQNVWGLSYVDAMVLRDRDTNSDGVLEERRYAQQDANYNVTSITDTSGNVKERYQYDPYGVVTILNGASDADSSVTDWSADANNTSDWGWVYLHQGGRYDSTTKLYAFRHRDYSPTLQRWMQEDPMGYVDGMNSYEYVGDNPQMHTDAFGLRFNFGDGFPPDEDVDYIEKLIEEIKKEANQELKQIIEDMEKQDFKCSIKLVYNANDVLVGDWTKKAIDITDLKKLPRGPNDPAQGWVRTQKVALIHELVEQWEKQKNGVSDFPTAHEKALKIERLYSNYQVFDSLAPKVPLKNGSGKIFWKSRRFIRKEVDGKVTYDEKIRTEIWIIEDGNIKDIKTDPPDPPVKK